MKNQYVLSLIVAMVFGVGGYLAGAQMAKASGTNHLAQGNFGGGAAFAGRTGSRAGNNAVFGTIISKDVNGVTVQLGGPNATSTNGNASGTRIVLVNDSTQISKMAMGSASDLTVGTGVVASGTTNSDGSLTATSVQIRPVSTGGVRGAPMMPVNE